MNEADVLALSNGIISLLLIISEIIGWSTCDSNSISELILYLFKGNKCIGGGDLEKEGQV